MEAWEERHGDEEDDGAFAVANFELQRTLDMKPVVRYGAPHLSCRDELEWS